MPSETTPLVSSRSSHPCIRFVRRYSSLISQVTILALDALFFASKVDPRVPFQLSKGSLVALSCIGFVGLPYTIDLIRKTAIDALFGYRAANRAVAILAGLRVVELVSNLSLMSINLAAAIEGIENQDQIQSNLYRTATPFGEAGIILGMGLNVGFMVVNYRTRKILPSCDRVMLLKAFESPNEEIYNAAAVRFCMDKDTLGVLLSRIEETDSQDELVKVVESNLQTEQRVHLAAKFVFSLIGDALMAIEKYFTPNSLVSASINLATATLYTGITTVKYWREFTQRGTLAKT